MIATSFCKDWLFSSESGIERTVCLPHDAMLLEGRSTASLGTDANAFFLGGKYSYEKEFFAPNEWQNKHVELEFDGVYRNAKVYVNGKLAGGSPYGYIPFFVDLCPYLKYNENNSIEVTVDNSELPNTRWYSGSGIYRPVMLWIGEKDYVKPRGIRVSTKTIAPPTVHIEIDYTGQVTTAAIEILTKDGTVIYTNEAFELPSQSITIDNAKLWDEYNPNIYILRVRIGDEIAETTFGIRTIEWSNKGLFINGKETLLRGGCIHSDNGIVGAASFAESEERRIRILKEAGYNAIRSAHNPASENLLKACDKYGMYVMDEGWDMWYCRKNAYDYALQFEENYLNDIKSMTEKDFCHPCVIMYSIGNENGEPAEKRGQKMAHNIANAFRAADPTRPVSGGMNLGIIGLAKNGTPLYKGDGGGGANMAPTEMRINSTLYNMLIQVAHNVISAVAASKRTDRVASLSLNALDICGYNYNYKRYKKDGKEHPERVIFGSETNPPDIVTNWNAVKRYPYIIGDFMWTSWDYLGEAGLGELMYSDSRVKFKKPYPHLTSGAGVFDICGNETGELGLIQAAYGVLPKPYIAVQPAARAGRHKTKSTWRKSDGLNSWSWRNCEGTKVSVEVFFDCRKVRLQMFAEDGTVTDYGTKKALDYTATFNIPYKSGRLVATAYDANNTAVGQSELCSARGKLRLVGTPEKLAAKVGEIVYVNYSIIGDNNVIEQNADCIAKIIQTENCEVLGFGSAKPSCEYSFVKGEYPTYRGKVQAAIKVVNGKKAKLILCAEGMQNCEVTINIQNEGESK